MKPHEYHALAMRTKSHDQTPVQRLTNAALGLAGEFAEVFSLQEWGDDKPKSALKECGDLLWYCAQAADSQGATFADIQWFDVPRPVDTEMVVSAIGAIAEIAKKAMFHGHPLTGTHRHEVLTQLRPIVLWTVQTLAIYGWTLEQAMAANIDKLRKRYPEGFSAEASINREDAVYDE